MDNRPTSIDPNDPRDGEALCKQEIELEPYDEDGDFNTEAELDRVLSLSDEELEDETGQQYIPGIGPRLLRELQEKHSKGFDFDRVPYNWRELLVYQIWLKYQKTHYSSESFVHYLFSDRQEFRRLSRQEKTLVAKGFSSAVQWFATNVGHCLMDEMLRAQGYSLRTIETSLTDKEKMVREKALQLFNTIERAKAEVRANFKKIGVDHVSY